MCISLSVPRAIEAEELPALPLRDFPARRFDASPFVIIPCPPYLATLGLVGRRDAPVAASPRKRRVNAADKKQENRGVFVGGQHHSDFWYVYY